MLERGQLVRHGATDGVTAQGEVGKLLQLGYSRRDGVAEGVTAQVEGGELLQLGYNRRDGAAEGVSAQVEGGEPCEVQQCQGNTTTARQALAVHIYVADAPVFALVLASERAAARAGVHLGAALALHPR